MQVLEIAEEEGEFTVIVVINKILSTLFGCLWIEQYISLIIFKDVSVCRSLFKLSVFYADINLYGYSRRPAFAFGRVERRMADHAAANGITLGSKSLYMSPKSLGHARRDTKQRKGLALSVAEIASFPKARRKMDLYFDGESYIYTDYKAKFIIHPNYEVSKKKRAAFITAGSVRNPQEFTLPKYKKV